MTPPTIFDCCEPRHEVLAGELPDSIFAADLWDVIRGKAHGDYQDPLQFFEGTHPTQNLKRLVKDVAERLAGVQGVTPFYKLETGFGGGKTHSLLALYHMVGEKNAKDLPGLESIGSINALFAKVDRYQRHSIGINVTEMALYDAKEYLLNCVVLANSTLVVQEYHGLLSSKQIEALPRPRWLQFLESWRGCRKISRTDSFAVAPGFAATPPVQPMRSSYPGG